MLNLKDFTKRIEKILDYYELNATSFAEKIEVGRSSISHIISGRNKPSLDFIMKILEQFPEVNFNWLVYGKGNFPTSNFQEEKISETPIQNSATPTRPKPEIQIQKDSAKENISRKPKKIILLYEDGNFEVYDN